MKNERAEMTTENAVRKIVVATGNAHKVDEIRSALAFEGWEFVALSELGDFSEPIEDGETFEDNARIKAHAAHEATGMATLADDSGLVVDALGGRPGVHSSRYAGENATDADNNRKLLSELAGLDQDGRSARFVSTLVFINEDGSEIVARGTCEGMIGTEQEGDNGFGYDPLFLPFALGGHTMAELTMDEKNRISHRGAALEDLKRKLV